MPWIQTSWPLFLAISIARFTASFCVLKLPELRLAFSWTADQWLPLLTTCMFLPIIVDLVNNCAVTRPDRLGRSILTGWAAQCDLQVAWHGNQLRCHIECVRSPIARSAERGDIPTMIWTISLLNVGTDEICLITTRCTTIESSTASHRLPVLQPRAVPFRSGKPAWAAYVFYIHNGFGL